MNHLDLNFIKNKKLSIFIESQQGQYSTYLERDRSWNDFLLNERHNHKEILILWSGVNHLKIRNFLS